MVGNRLLSTTEKQKRNQLRNKIRERERKRKRERERERWRKSHWNMYYYYHYHRAIYHQLSFVSLASINQMKKWKNQDLYYTGIQLFIVILIRVNVKAPNNLLYTFIGMLYMRLWFVVSQPRSSKSSKFTPCQLLSICCCGSWGFRI